MDKSHYGAVESHILLFLQKNDVHMDALQMDL